MYAAFVLRRMRIRMEAAGRWISWNTLESLLARGEGILILDSACRPGLVWWTDDPLLADPGLLVMADDRFRRVSHDQLEKGVERLLPQSRFQSRFLDAATGKAAFDSPNDELRRIGEVPPRIPAGAELFAVNEKQGRTANWRRGRK